MAYLVRVNTPGELALYGTDSTSEVMLVGPFPGISRSGYHAISLPLSSPLGDAHDLLTDIGSAAVSVSRYSTATDTFDVYPGGPNFSITPGEGYLVRVISDTTYEPPVGGPLALVGGSALGLLGVWFVRLRRRGRAR